VVEMETRISWQYPTNDMPNTIQLTSDIQNQYWKC